MNLNRLEKIFPPHRLPQPPRPLPAAGSFVLIPLFCLSPLVMDGLGQLQIYQQAFEQAGGGAALLARTGFARRVELRAFGKTMIGSEVSADFPPFGISSVLPNCSRIRKNAGPGVAAPAFLRMRLRYRRTICNY